MDQIPSREVTTDESSDDKVSCVSEEEVFTRIKARVDEEMISRIKNIVEQNSKDNTKCDARGISGISNKGSLGTTVAVVETDTNPKISQTEAVKEMVPVRCEDKS